MTEVITRTFVMTPITITAVFWMAWFRMISTILKTSQLDYVSVFTSGVVHDFHTQRQREHILNESLQHVAKPL